ncbi:HsdM family class I SAM-dependent methyltransferase [Polyangium spumosum]|uniref:site-specific DNA-methyltransferase (adenine-specific) n=1 Tax=Polyangium spumosum TaxID=889282 RepID=A0A6N7PIV0_9BACT|nr:N-6 DNA methylase [Polyangium spumosum]MRG90756.1 N-6 DNA methylase [Polyangium spumosum]
MQQAATFLKGRLARRQKSQDAFVQFLTALRDLLTRPWIRHAGRAVALHEYLASREAEGATDGDEAPVVDQLVRDLLGALGYTQADYAYNRPLGTTKRRNVPDFSVYARDFVDAPVFVIEDKSTSVRDLHARTGGAPGDESPFDQLRRYVRSGAVHGRTGMLCNGWVLEAWQLGADGDSRLLHLDLRGLSLHYAKSSDPHPPEPWKGALYALWSRFSRAAFSDADVDSREMLRMPPMSPAWVAKLNERLAATCDPAVLQDDIDAYLEEAWRAVAIDVAGAADTLVDVIRVLIDDFAEDVRHQLDDALARHATYVEASRKEFAEAKVEALWAGIALKRSKFDIAEDAFAREVLEPLSLWRGASRWGEVRKLAAQCRKKLSACVRPPEAGKGSQRQMFDEGERAVGGVSKGAIEAHRKTVLEDFEQGIHAFCNEVIAVERQRADLEEQHRGSIQAANAFGAWRERVSSSVMVGATEDLLRAEFSRQTAYVYIIRLLLVRICEDKGLFKRKLSDGALLSWHKESARYLDYASGRSYDYLTRMAYECAQNVYTHFYGASRVFDWYRMDDKILLRALCMLNAFNLERIDTDIIGTVYGRYLVEGKHEQGRYYTRRSLVNLMLDMVGYEGGKIIGRRIADLACGSGSFLVEAARRLLGRYRGTDGKIPTAHVETALREVQTSILGIDVNPFACYLAETNLLIQVLDLIRQAQEEGLSFVVERFSIYSADALLVNEDLALVPGAAFALADREEAAVELAKARSGPFAQGFDFLVGNPPYVRADEEAPMYLAYRAKVQEQAWFSTRHLKWDLYVPFVEQYHRLLADGDDARACLVTIESLATAPYASKLRELLAREATVHEVLFAEDLKLFDDAAWQNNIVFSFSRGTPEEGHEVARSTAHAVRSGGEIREIQKEPLDRLVQADADPDRLFNKRAEARLDLTDTVRWDEICYVTKGMVLHSSERLSDGQVIQVPATYDPACFREEVVEDLGARGKRIRHRAFGRDELVSDVQDVVHARRYVGSREVLRGGIGKTRWLEYGEHTRCPSRVSRPTFPELYNRTKIMFGTFTGVAVDEGMADEYLVVSDSVRTAVRWSELEGVTNRALTDARKELKEAGRYAPDLSRDFSAWYLCALALSEPIQAWLSANKRSMKEHVYPEDIKAIPVKHIPPAEQAPFVELARERHRLWDELVALEAEGYRLGSRIEIPVHSLLERYRREHPRTRHLTLLRAMAAGLFRIDEAFQREDLVRVKADGDKLRIGRAVVGEIGEGVKEKAAVAEVLARVLASLPGPLQDRQDIDAIPATEKGLLDLAAWLEARESDVRARQDRIGAINAEIDRLARALYQPGG